ncbi:MAG: DUF927 domain-containing protein [Telluria sp.]
MGGRIGISELRAALTFIPADDRDLWWRIGMALKSELGDDGYSLFLEWSEKGASFDAKAAKATWKGFKPGGAVTVATLIWEAKERGFDPKQFAPAAPLSAVDKARLKKERAALDKAAADEAASLHARASAEAGKLWSAASTVGASDYLTRKGVKPHGGRFAAKALLIPLVDQHGKLWNVQRISDNGDKRFLPGGRVSGCFHVIGSIADSAWLLVAEGYATAAALHEATGYAAVVAFNAANLRHVTACMRATHPAMPMLICADDDRATEIKTGKNPGVAAAMAVANANGARWCKPGALPEGGTDFNDLAQASGLAAVARQVADAVRDVPAAAAAPAAAALAVAQPKVRPASGRRRGESSADSQSRKPFFTVNEDGVWFHGFDQRGEPMAALWICSELHITAQSRDAGDGDWGRLLEFSDPDGNPKRWVMPSTMLAGDGTQYRATLLGMGLRIGASVAAKNQLTVYIQTEKTEARVRCTDRIGWHDDVYVLPDRTIGESDEIVMFQAAGGIVSQFKQRGTLPEWRENVAAHCRGNSRMLFCVSTAFAAPLMHLAKISSGGFHIWGDSSSGKSTAVKVAGSVFGGKNYPRNWHTTGTSLESTATQHSDALLLLDEIAQVDPKVVGDIVYMLANEAGKGRGTQLATARKIATWRLLFLSDGEVSLASHMEQAGKGAKAGHDVRMAHINADAGQGLGVYETLHGFDSGAELSDHLVKMSHQYYGTAGIALIEHLVGDVANISDAIASGVSGLAREMCPPEAHGQVARVATRFALVGLSGEVATSAGITGWAPGEAITAARACFNNWLEGRGGAGNVEHVSILRQVSAFFQAHGNARFVTWHRSTDDHAPNTINRAGFRRYLTGEGAAINTNADHHRAYGDAVHPEESAKIEQEYFVLSEVFKNEICKGFNHKLVAQLLIKEGLLMPESAADGASATRKERLPGIGLVRCYRFKPGIVTAGA